VGSSTGKSLSTNSTNVENVNKASDKAAQNGAPILNGFGALFFQTY